MKWASAPWYWIFWPSWVTRDEIWLDRSNLTDSNGGVKFNRGLNFCHVWSLVSHNLTSSSWPTLGCEPVALWRFFKVRRPIKSYALVNRNADEKAKTFLSSISSSGSSPLSRLTAITNPFLGMTLRLERDDPIGHLLRVPRCTRDALLSASVCIGPSFVIRGITQRSLDRKESANRDHRS